jgi:hypothetical protein
MVSPTFRRTISRTCTLAVMAALAALMPAPAIAASGSGSSSSSGSAPSGDTGASVHQLLHSRELWATIDVCNPPDQAYTVGIRGSMPGNGHAREKMYMSFRLQYLDTTSKRWVDLVSGATPDFIAVGSAAAARQDGRSFQLVPGKSTSTLRGVVDFQWRRGGTILASAARPTTAGRKSLAGADPAGFSAASCPIS